MIHPGIPYLFAVYETVVLYILARIKGRYASLLLWLPEITFLLISLTGRLAKQMAERGSVRALLYRSVIAQPWNEHFFWKLIFCCCFSIMAYVVCRFGKRSTFTYTKGLRMLAWVAIFGLTLTVVIRYGEPNNTDNNDIRRWTNQIDGISYRWYEYGILYEDGSMTGVTKAEIPIYAAPENNADLIQTNPAGTAFDMAQLNFSHATDRVGWRYVTLNRTVFSGVEKVTGFIRLSDALRAAAAGQGGLLKNGFARARLLLEDDIAADEGAFITMDHMQIYIPIGRNISAIFLVGSLLLLCIKKKYHIVRKQSE